MTEEICASWDSMYTSELILRDVVPLYVDITKAELIREGPNFSVRTSVFDFTMRTSSAGQELPGSRPESTDMFQAEP